MSSVVVSGDTSGAITISAPAISGTNTLTLPAVTDTLVGLAATQTLTNKSIVASQLTGTVAVANGGTGVSAQSYVRVNTANGYGSTNTRIRRVTTTVNSAGSDITYADSATLGATFTINTAGVYSVSYTDQFTGISSFGVSINSSQLTTNIYSITVTDVLCGAQTSGANLTATCSATFYAAAASVVRAHTQATAAGLEVTGCQFTIARVA